MYKLIILFRTPKDIGKFEEDWSHKFVPFADAMPGVLRVEISTFEQDLTMPLIFYKTHELYFASRAALDEALNSDAGKQAGKALQKMAQGGYQLLLADVLEEDRQREGVDGVAKISSTDETD